MRVLRLVPITIAVFFILSAALIDGAMANNSRQYLSPAAGMKLSQSNDERIKNTVAQLREQAKQSGKTKVIIGLKVLFAPEGELSEVDANSQRSDIANSVLSVRKRLQDRGMANPASIRDYPSIPFMALEVTPNELEFLLSDDDVISIEPDRENKPLLAQSSPIVGAPTAWAAGATGAGKVVAVIDSGVDKNHPFLSGKVVSEACYSASFCPGGAPSSIASGSGLNCPSSYTGCDHGTHVAGIVAGTNANQSGVAKGANLIAIQVFSASGSSIGASDSNILSGLQRVYDLRTTYSIASVNMSLGSGGYTSNCDALAPSMKAMIDNLKLANIATVVASGNDGYINGISFPSCISSAVSVGATWDVAGQAFGCDTTVSSVDKVACFSNSASFLNLLAPGISINSSVPGTGFMDMPGTSMAAPHVAGAFAVLSAAAPSASVNTILNTLISTGTSVTDYRNGIVKPRINVAAARNALVPASTVTLGAATYSVSEGTASISIPVTRTSTAGTATVNYATANGTATAGTGQDYTAVSGTLNFAAGVATVNISVPILNDTTAERSETFTVALNTPSAGMAIGTPSSSTITITDNEPASVGFGAATYSVSEAGPSIVIPVTKLGTLGASTSVPFATANGTATGGSDFTSTSGTLTFAAGVSSQNITVPITNDTAAESNETFNVNLSTATGMTLRTPSSTAVTIVDNDATVRIGAATYSVSEGTASISIPVTRTSTAGTATVNYATANGTATAGTGQDYTAVSGTLNFAAGVATVNISVPILNDTTAERSETFTVALNTPSAGMAIGTPSSSTITITDNEPASVGFGAATYSVSEAGPSIVIPVTKLGTLGASTSVPFATANGTATGGSDFTSTSGTLTFAAGVSSQNITVPITNDTAAESNETFNVNLSTATGMTLRTPSSTAVTIVDNDVASTVSIGSATYSVSEGTASISIPVTRTSTVGTASVNFATANGSASAGSDYTATSGTLNFLAGAATANISVPILNDTTGELSENFTVSLNTPSAGMSIGSPSSTSVAIADNDIVTLSNNVALSVSGTTGSKNYYAITVPAGISNLTVTLSDAVTSNPGNGNLYVKLNAVPSTLGIYDCAPNGAGNNEGCSYINPAAGTYYVLIDGISAYSQVYLQASYAVATPLTNSVAVTNISGASGSSKYYSITVPTGATNLQISTSGGTGDVDLYVMRNLLPTAFVDCYSAYLGNNESCAAASPLSGVYYIELYGYQAYSGVSLVASYGGVASLSQADGALKIGSLKDMTPLKRR